MMDNQLEQPISRQAATQRIYDRILVFLPLLCYAVIYVTWFNHLEAKHNQRYTVIHTALDEIIPFAEIFILPYLAWFIYVSFTIIYFLLKYDLDDYIRLSIFLCAGMTVFLVVSTVWPNMQDLRPAAMPRDNIFTRMVLDLYSRDTCTNVWPSIHVYNSIGAHLAIRRSNRISKPAKVASFVQSALIILSTMFIKQHSVFDVLSAFVMAGGFYIFAYRSEFMDMLCERRHARSRARIAH